MYKYAGVGLVGLFFMMIIPSGLYTTQETGFNMYGAATVDLYDENRDSVFTQTVHNRLFDAGEDFILDQTFTGLGGTAVADDVQIGAICLSGATLQTTEGTSAGTFNTNKDAVHSGDDTQENCHTDGTVTSTGQIATIGPLTYTAAADNTLDWVGGDVIIQVGICRADVADADVEDCDTTLFAVADVSDLTLNAGNTVDVTYTFDLSSSGT